MFRGKFIAALKADFALGRFTFPGRTTVLGTPSGFSDLVGQLYRKDWVVYCKPPFGGPKKVLDYLGHYTHRVAISNHRIQAVTNGNVTFAYHDRRDGDTVKTMTIPGEEFIRRFMLHALPPSFMRIRHFGFLANRSKAHDLARCRELLGLAPGLPEEKTLTTQEHLRELTGKDPTQCPACKVGVLKIVREFPRLPLDAWPHFPFPSLRLDSS